MGMGHMFHSSVSTKALYQNFPEGFFEIFLPEDYDLEISVSI